MVRAINIQPLRGCTVGGSGLTPDFIRGYSYSIPSGSYELVMSVTPDFPYGIPCWASGATHVSQRDSVWSNLLGIVSGEITESEQ